VTLPISGAKPWIIAHRGAAHACPENTMAAFERALADGAAAIELDLQMTSDDQVVVFHDRTLEKVGLPDRRVAELNIEEIAALDAGSWFSEEHAGAKIPLLDEVLERFAPRTVLILEIKARDVDIGTGRHMRLLERATETVLAHSAQDRVAWISFSAEALWRARELAPEIPVILNTGRPPLSRPEFLAHCERLSAVSFPVAELDVEEIVAVHEAGLRALSYPVETGADVALATRFMVDGLLTSRPGWVAGQLQGEGVS